MRPGRQLGLGALVLLSNFFPALGDSPSALLPHHPGGEGWRAKHAAQGPSPFDGLTIKQAIGMMGTRNQGPEALKKATGVPLPTAGYIPTRMDLRKTHGHCGALTRVLNQGACGSCYAMAATQAISAALCMGAEAGGGVDDSMMSTQDMLGCSGKGNSTVKLSCWGGTITEAMGYLCEFGVVEESCVPYTAGFTWRDSQSVDSCRRSCAIPQAHVRRRAVPNATTARASAPAATVKKPSAECAAGTMLLNTEAQVKSAVMSVGPAVAYLDVYRSFLHYSDGIYKCPQPSHCARTPTKKDCPLAPCAGNPDCELQPPGPKCTDCLLGGHAVQIIGWGGDGTTVQKYWLVKNTWGPDWGEGGYFKISALPEENCNLMVDCLDPTRSKECIVGVSPNNPYAPVPGVTANKPQVPFWEDLAAWALFTSSLVSAFAAVWLLVTTVSHSELRQYPFNRLTLAALFLLPLSLAQASFLPMEALFLIDDPLACDIAGRVYVVCALGFTATCAVTALAGLVHSCSPIERGEGCSDAGTCLANTVVFSVVSVGLPVGMCIAQAFALDSGYWPSPLRCTMHSQKWNQLLFDVPMGWCLGACLLGVLANLAQSTRDPEEHSREWTFQRMQLVLLAGVAVWVPEAILASLVALDIPTGQSVLVFVEALCTGLVGAIFTASAIRALDLDMFVSWKAMKELQTIGAGDRETDAFLPGLEKGRGLAPAVNHNFTFFEGWGGAVTVESGWHGSGSQLGLSPPGGTGSATTDSDSLSSFSGAPQRVAWRNLKATLR